MARNVTDLVTWRTKFFWTGCPMDLKVRTFSRQKEMSIKVHWYPENFIGSFCTLILQSELESLSWLTVFHPCGEIHSNVDSLNNWQRIESRAWGMSWTTSNKLNRVFSKGQNSIRRCSEEDRKHCINVLNASSSSFNCEASESHPGARRQRGFSFSFLLVYFWGKPELVRIDLRPFGNTRFNCRISLQVAYARRWTHVRFSRDLIRAVQHTVGTSNCLTAMMLRARPALHAQIRSRLRSEPWSRADSAEETRLTHCAYCARGRTCGVLVSLFSS